MSGVLDGRVAIVTGAAGDIGAAIAAALVAEGAKVALFDVDRAALDAMVARRFDAQAPVMARACNITDASQVRDGIDAVVARWGALHVLVNNAAAVTPTADIGDASEHDWETALDVNLSGAWRMARHAIPRMTAAGGGVVLNIASQLGHVARRGRGAYGVTKAALLALTRAIAVDHADDGIRAVSLSPGAVLTSRLVRRYGSEAAARDALVRDYPARRIGTPDEVARAAVYLVGPGAAFVTGTDLLIDGGYTAV